MAWVSEVIADGSGQWAGNQVCFATREEALAAGRNLMNRWTRVSDYCATEVDQPVNYRWDASKPWPGALVAVQPTEAPDA
jgi:hypothetical protein